MQRLARRVARRVVNRLRLRDDKGFVLVWVALSMTVFMACAAMSIDVGRWYTEGHRMQKAADAAALAGVIYLPATPPTQAFSTATDIATRNGYTDGQNGTTITMTVLPKGTQLQVTITRTIKNMFANAIGIPTTTITRTAVAEYEGPIPMGSPTNTFGNQPAYGSETNWSNNPAAPNLWANISGPLQPKGNGDAYQSDVLVNTEYNPDGYTYDVRVPSTAIGQTLAIELYDPSWVVVNDHCDSTNMTGLTTITNNYVKTTTEAAARYAANDDATSPGKPFCTGDQNNSGTNVDTTTFVIRKPDLTPWDTSDNVAMSKSDCGSSLAATSGLGTNNMNINDVAPVEFPGYNQALAPLLDKTQAGTYNDDLARRFRRWVRVCQFNVQQAGDYEIQVRTDVPPNAADPTLPIDMATAKMMVGAGHNRFAIRAAYVNGATFSSNAGVSVFAAANMAMYTNGSGTNTQFYLARVLPSAAGETLQVKFYDIGDAGGTGTLTIQPPPDSNTTAFSNCQPENSGGSPLYGNVNGGTLTNCGFTTSGAFNATWTIVDVPIPQNYTCDTSNAANCWVRVNYNYGAGNQVQDTTTWTASIIGDPVRLVK
jgi:Flp pilus assembly protein TadG